MGDESGAPVASIEKGILWKVHLAQLVVQLGYGTSYVLSKVAMTIGVNPIVFSVYRDAVCLVVLVPVALITERHKRVPLSIPLLAQLVAFAFFGNYSTQLLVMYGISLTSASYASTVSVLTPLFTFIISMTFGFEQIRWNRLDGQVKFFGLVSSVIGATVLAFYFGPVVLGPADSGIHRSASELDPMGILVPTAENHQIGSWQFGIMLLFLAGLTLSICISIQVPIMARFPAPISVSAISYVLGATFLALTALLTVEDSSSWVLTERAAVIGYVFNGLVPAGLGFTLIIWSVKAAGPLLVGSYIPLQLFTASAMAYFFLRESIHLGSVLGTILIINGLGFITWGKVKSENLASHPPIAVALLDSISPVAVATGLAEPLLG